MGVRGPTPPVRGRCREATEGVGWRSYGHEVPVGRRRRNYPAYYEPDLKPAPSSAPVCALGHLPPRGKALVGNRPPHPALRATFPPGGRLWWGIAPSPGPSGHLPPRGKDLVGNRPLIRPFGPPSPQGEGFGGELSPHPALRATFPPGGRLWWGIVPLIRPFGPPSPQGEGFGGESPPHPALRATFPRGGRLTGGQRPPLQKPPPTGHP